MSEVPVVLKKEDVEKDSVFQTFLKAKGFSEYLKMVLSEYVLNEKKSSIEKKDNAIFFKIKNDRDEEIVIRFALYKTSKTLTVNALNYKSKNLGKYKNIDIVLNSSKKINDFIKKVKYTEIEENDLINDVNLETEKIFEKLNKFVLDRINDNILCFSENVFSKKDIEKKTNDFFQEFKIREDIPKIINLFLLFDRVSKLSLPKLFMFIISNAISEFIIQYKHRYLNREAKFSQEKYIEVVSENISYSHFLQFYNGKCKFLHGHDAKLKIRIYIEDQISRSMFMSFGALKRILKKIENEMDHKFVWCLSQTDKISKSTINKNFNIVSSYQTLMFSDLESVVLCPYYSANTAFSTSENILNNYVRPLFILEFFKTFLHEENADTVPNITYPDFLNEIIKVIIEWSESDQIKTGISFLI